MHLSDTTCAQRKKTCLVGAALVAYTGGFWDPCRAEGPDGQRAAQHRVS
jgi:hypothetical protein